MILHEAEYCDSDAAFAELRDFLVESYRMAGRPDNWLYNRLEDWRFGVSTRSARPDPEFFRRNVCLWRDESDRLLAFAVSYGDDAVFLQVHPNYRFLYELMVPWVDQSWAQGRPAAEVYAFDNNRQLANLLAGRGFCVEGSSGYLRRYDLSHSIPLVSLPDGFRITTLADCGNYDSYIEAVSSAFDHPNLDREWFETRAAAPGYEMNWDLVMLSPEDQVAAFCLVRLDHNNRVAQLDPIGTHPYFQRNGLARAMVLESFHRLARQGYCQVYISSGPEPLVSNRLYDSLLPAEKYHEKFWVKHYPQTEACGEEPA